MKKEFGEYFLGLDIGTETVGWAVTDQEYNILKFNKKHLWGVRTFTAGKVAEERRLFRTTRRRLKRRKQRIALLQEIFSEQISKIDFGFFERLKDSKYLAEDKTQTQPFGVFNDSRFNDKDFFKKYPTIYHLRKELIRSDRTFDVRLVYLALHHILKNRGHFLFAEQKLASIISLDEALISINNCAERLELKKVFDISNQSEIEKVLLQKSGITKRSQALALIINGGKTNVVLAKLICGGKIRLSDLFLNEGLEDYDVKSISFSDKNFDALLPQLEDSLLDKVELILCAKSLHDWSLLASTLQGELYLSLAKVKVYEKHKADLALLKKTVRKHCAARYGDIFSNPSNNNNYCAYIGHYKISGKKYIAEKKCAYEDFTKFIKSQLSEFSANSESIQKILGEMDVQTFLPKQVVKSNAVIPYQVQETELLAILNNAKRYLPFLEQKDEDGLTPGQKIHKIFQFRIPYYVGPLNKASTFSWLERRPGRITPWNFKDQVDLQESAEKFILRMTNKCTYLKSFDVLPKNSLIYSEFMVLNELNNLKINDEKITPELKNRIFAEIFCKYRNVSISKLKVFLEKECSVEKPIIGGIDNDFKQKLNSHHDFVNVFGIGFEKSKAEAIIRAIVLFGEDKKLLKRRICDEFSDLTKEQIKQICTLKYTGWGRLSKEFLTEIVEPNKETGEAINIIQALRDGNENLMELLGGKHNYQDQINKHNEQFLGNTDKISYELLENSYLSPRVRRGVWQALKVVQEVVKITGHEPKKVFIEVTRQEGIKGDAGRKKSRRDRLIELYENCKDLERDFASELSSANDADLRRDMLYLYYEQMGKCMYSAEPISLAQLNNSNIYDIDHIFPQSKITDDSLDNRVLVLKDYNNIKKDQYPLPVEWQKKMRGFWNVLKEKGFISDKKFTRLTRTMPFSEDELAGFINRQIVETGQSVKAVAEILKQIFKKSSIVYVKAVNVSKFRQDYNIVKCREVNEFHHAKDAYLNIVVGNVYDTKFTRNPLNFVKENYGKYSMNRVFDYNVPNAWSTDGNLSLATVKMAVKRNDITVTKHTFEVQGGFFDQQIVKKGRGQFPIKSKDPHLAHLSRNEMIDRYGGYNKLAGAYFVLVEHTEKAKRVCSFEHIPVMFAKSIKNADDILKFCIDELKLKEPKIVIEKIKKKHPFEH